MMMHKFMHKTNLRKNNCLCMLFFLILSKCIKINGFSQSMISFYQGPSDNTEMILNTLDQTGTDALFLFDPYDEDFTEEALKKVLSKRNAIGMFIPKAVADLKGLDKQLNIRQNINFTVGFNGLIFRRIF